MTMIITTSHRRWIEEPERSTTSSIAFYWNDGVAWARIPVPRSLVDDPEFDPGTWLDDMADEALAANREGG